MRTSPRISRRGFLGVGLALGLSQIGFAYAATPWTWSSARGLNTARYNHKAVLLSTGQVLVAGGVNNPTYPQLTWAELYDPKKDRWTMTGSMNDPRNGHTLTLLSTGQVLVVGGSYISNPSAPGSWLSSAELYDPVTGVWTRVASMNASRSGQTATLLPSGQVLVAGGYNDTTGYLSSAEVYDPTANTWTSTGSLLNPRIGHTAALLSSGEVLVVGGINSGVSLNSAELYDPSTGVWTTAGGLSYARSGHTATILSNNQVLIAGGSTDLGVTNLVAAPEIYDPMAGSWTITANLTIPRTEHTATLLTNGEVLIAGGYNGSAIASAEIYDPLARTWSAAASLTLPRSSHTATSLPSGKVLAAGGLDGTTVLASAELFNAKSK